MRGRRPGGTSHGSVLTISRQERATASQMLPWRVNTSVLINVYVWMGQKSVLTLSKHLRNRWSSVPLGGAVVPTAEGHQKDRQ
jgi:hypothetical protein